MKKAQIRSFIPFLKKTSGGELDTYGEAKFGTFQGVFRPTILTIIGPLMFLREGWVVGNAGILGAVLMVLLGCAVTGITSLSISTIVSNTRIGSGGVFSLISQSLGLQVGGSVGLALFLSQGVSAPMYMYGFAEGWSFLFPEHSSKLVLLALFAITATSTFISARLAFRLQIVVMVGVIVSVSSIFFGSFSSGLSYETAELWGDFSDGNFFTVFAIYFPTFTGVMVGASMSGNLKNPRKSIPYGTMLAWGVSSVLYFLLVFWYAGVATPEELRVNNLVSVQKSLVPLAVFLGILSCCASATISSLVAAPRVLQALANYKIVPFSSYLKILKNGEPRNAALVTGVMVLPLLLFFDGINDIAPLVTQITISIYFLINTVLAIEMQLNMISFRPQIRLPKYLPAAGSFLSIMIMFLMNPALAFVALSIVIGTYIFLSAKKVNTPWETVQSGLFIALAEWGVMKALQANIKKNKRNWKPDLLVPVFSSTDIDQVSNFIYSVTFPKGSLRFLIMQQQLKKNGESVEKTFAAVQKIRSKNNKVGLLSTASVMDEQNVVSAISSTISVVKGFFLSPNSLFLLLRDMTPVQFKKTLQLVSSENIALVVAHLQPTLQKVFRKRKIVLWVRDQSPHWKLSLSLSNLDYAILLAYQLRKNWNAQLELRCVAVKPQNIPLIKTFLSELSDLARLGEISTKVYSGTFESVAGEMKVVDVNILGLADNAEKKNMERICKLMQSSCIFVKDSGIGLESALI